MTDDIDRKLLRELQLDARISYAELGRRVGLTTPAVIERVRKLEDAGIVTGYRVDIDTARIGLPITAFIRMSITGVDYSHIIEGRTGIERSSRMPPRYRWRFIHNEGRRLVRRTPAGNDRSPDALRHHDNDHSPVIPCEAKSDRALILTYSKWNGEVSNLSASSWARGIS
jgi:DNA-binding Lrp family transcriptional regulator